MADSDVNAPPGRADRASLVTRNARYGLILFAVYVAMYVGFIACALSPKVIGSASVAGLNLAIVYGMALIVAAFALAIVYMVMCGREGTDDGDGGRG